MSRHERGDYPPAWDPPPRTAWDEPQQPPLLNVVRVLSTHDAAPWVRAIFIEKFERKHLYAIYRESDREEILKLIDSLPEAVEIRARNAETLNSPAPTTRSAP